MTIEYLEKYSPKIEIINNVKKVFCIIRKKHINYTPEEKVRQAFIKFLIEEKNVPNHKIKVEESVKPFENTKGRIDILILNADDIPYIIYECKQENDYLTDEVRMQGLRYFCAFRTIGYIGYVIGDFVELIGYHSVNNKIETFEMAHHPTYDEFCYEDDLIVEDFEEEEFERLRFKEPIEIKLIEKLYDNGVVGEGTDRKLLPLLINLFGWILDESDEFKNSWGIQDKGVIFTKFGNAGGGFFAQHYRRFVMKKIVDKPIISIGLNSMVSGEKSPIGTSLFVGIGTDKHSHSSLELRCDKYIEINSKIANIWHDGTITVGKLGASKRQDLLDFISTKENNILFDNKIVLGKIDFSEEIKSGQNQTKEFIKNIIEYALLRDEFRVYKKSITKKR